MEELELALEDCLQQLGSGRLSLGQCLARYPQYSAELRPLLETSLRMRKGKSVRPSGAARDKTRDKLAGFIEGHPRKPRNLPKVPRFSFLTLVVVLALGSVGTAFAQDALPGQPLYSWKLSTEWAWRAVAQDPIAADLALAQRREGEILQVAGSKSYTTHPDNSAVAESQGITAYTDILDRLANDTSGPDGPRIITVLEWHQASFSHAGIDVPKLDDIVLRSENGSRKHTPNGPKP